MNQVVHRLSTRFAAIEVDEVAEVVHECHAQMAGSPIRDFVPLLVERAARERLRAMVPTAVESSPDIRRATAGRPGILRTAFGDGNAWTIL